MGGLRRFSGRHQEGVEVTGTQENVQILQRCTLCPAGCQLGLASAGPDLRRIEYPVTSGAGLCPRGSMLPELMSHPRRILAATRRDGSKLDPPGLDAAFREILDAASGRQITILLDGNLPREQLTTAAAWVRNWPGAQMAFAVEPSDRELLLGIVASGAEYLGIDDLHGCDGFLIIGDAFAANPRCARGILDLHQEKPKTPIVTIDPAAGTASKFATHPVDVEPDGELAALAAIASDAGVEDDLLRTTGSNGAPSAHAAGKAIAGCKRLCVLLAAEYARTAAWKQIGYLAGRLAQTLGGGVAPQTAGANVLAAVRLEERGDAIPLAEAIAAEGDVKVAVGCDVLGMFGRRDIPIFAAAAALPNTTTDIARIVLPSAMPGEYSGSYLFDCRELAEVTPLMPPPADVPTPGDLVAALAQAAGVPAPVLTPDDAPATLAVDPPVAVACAEPPTHALLFAREASRCGCGELSSHASWQRAGQPLPGLRMSPHDAEELNLKNLAIVTVHSNGASVSAQLRVTPGLPPGRLVLPEACARTRSLAPSRTEPDRGAVVTEPPLVRVDA